MTNLLVFKNEAFGQIRTFMRNEEPWFVARDVASALGYKRANKAILDHVFSEDKMIFKVPKTGTLDFKVSNYGITIINESGLYCLILSSKLPQAKGFKQWITSEVLPSIRKTGAYALHRDERKQLTAPEHCNSLFPKRKIVKPSESREYMTESQNVQNDLTAISVLIKSCENAIDAKFLPESLSTAQRLALNVMVKISNLERIKLTTYEEY